MSDGITDGERSAKRYNAWLTENSDAINKNWDAGRIVSGIGSNHLTDEFEPELETYVRQKLIEYHCALTGTNYSFNNSPHLCFTYLVSIKVEKVEEIKYGGPIEKRRTEIPIMHFGYTQERSLCGLPISPGDHGKTWTFSQTNDVNCPVCKGCIANTLEGDETCDYHHTVGNIVYCEYGPTQIKCRVGDCPKKKSGYITPPVLLHHLKHPNGVGACGIALDDNKDDNWTISIEDTNCPQCKAYKPKCPDCNDTGIDETGNNDLPCHCEAGDKALFNTCEHPKGGPVTGKHIKDCHLNGSPNQCPDYPSERNIFAIGFKPRVAGVDKYRDCECLRPDGKCQHAVDCDWGDDVCADMIKTGGCPKDLVA